MLRARLVFLAALFVCGVAHPHMDRILTVQPDGLIPEIPASLGKVFLKISSLGTSAPSVEFSVGQYHNNLPACLTKAIHSRQSSDVKITGSWYHNESIVPFYIVVQFYEPRTDPELPYGNFVRIMFNLHDARVQELSRVVNGQGLEVELPDDCVVSKAAS